jgi:hypothetical protein
VLIVQSFVARRVLAGRHCAAAVCVLWLLAGCGPSEQKQLETALVGRGRVALVDNADNAELNPTGAQLIRVSSVPPLAAALSGTDPAALSAAMAQTGVQALLLDLGSGHVYRGLAQQLASFAHVDGLQGAYFNRGAALYVLDPVHVWSRSLRAGLATVARRLLGGAPPPRIASFPDVVRKLEPVEVMVLLRSGDQPRLWRSARGSSFARALLTATAVARQRWVERSTALGGKLDALLPGMTVELSLLQDDGEIGTRNEGFVDKVTLLEHGVGYERKGGWHYLLPEATHKQDRAPSLAYRQLFKDDGLPVDSLKHNDLRLYRLAVQRIGVSEPTAADNEPHDDLSDVAEPAEVLGR